MNNLPNPISALEKNNELNLCLKKLQSHFKNEDVSKSEVIQRFATPFKTTIVNFLDENPENKETFDVVITNCGSKVIINDGTEELVVQITNSKNLSDKDFAILKELLIIPMMNILSMIDKVQFRNADNNKVIDALLKISVDLLKFSVLSTEKEIKSISNKLLELDKTLFAQKEKIA